MNKRFFFGLALLAVAAGLIWMGPNLCRLLPGICRAAPTPAPTPVPVVTLKGIGGGSKSGLLNDAEVVRILSDTHHIKINYTTSGSLVLPECKDCDFLWPGNEADVERYKAAHGGKVSFERVLQSPLVFYSWNEAVDVLAQRGLVRQEGGVYYFTDVAGFLDLNRQGKTWKDIGLSQVFGRVAITPADPTAADSGNGFAAYMGGMFLGGQVPDRTSIEAQLPEIKAYVTRLGFLEKSTGNLWKSYVTKGLGAYPIIVAYESLGIELIQNDPDRERLLRHVRIVYPQPTIWYTHPLIFVTDRGQQLGAALKDPAIQKIAWERHGFRSAVIGIKNDPAAIQFPGVAPEILSVMPLPAPEVLDRITEYLKQQPQ